MDSHGRRIISSSLVFLKTRLVEGLMHIKFVVAQLPPAGVAWTFGKEVPFQVSRSVDLSINCLYEGFARFFEKAGKVLLTTPVTKDQRPPSVMKRLKEIPRLTRISNLINWLPPPTITETQVESMPEPDEIGNLIEEVLHFASQINLEVDSDDVQELLVSHHPDTGN
ncbi:hypothetical protein TNCV_331311 [Trichonephila clavipes]|nr:hypothetical protein TNCV_331311 [Trichonephila clavipes]